MYAWNRFHPPENVTLLFLLSRETQLVVLRHRKRIGGNDRLNHDEIIRSEWLFGFIVEFETDCRKCIHLDLRAHDSNLLGDEIARTQSAFDIGTKFSYDERHEVIFILLRAMEHRGWTIVQVRVHLDEVHIHKVGLHLVAIESVNRETQHVSDYVLGTVHLATSTGNLKRLSRRHRYWSRRRRRSGGRRRIQWTFAPKLRALRVDLRRCSRRNRGGWRWNFNRGRFLGALDDSLPNDWHAGRLLPRDKVLG